jgi:hypothetical protein
MRNSRQNRYGRTIRQRSKRLSLKQRAKAESQGLGDFSPMWAGQNTSGCREVSAYLLTRELAGGS